MGKCSGVEPAATHFLHWQIHCTWAWLAVMSTASCPAMLPVAVTTVLSHAITQVTYLPTCLWRHAGLVVALRRSLKDLVGRAAGFVEEGVKLEQQLQQQVRGLDTTKPMVAANVVQ